MSALAAARPSGSGAELLPGAGEDGFFGIRFESIGGLGAHLAGKILAEAGVLGQGLNGAHFSSYGSEKKGTPVKSFVRFCPADRELRTSSPIESPQVVAVFHAALAHSLDVAAGLSAPTFVTIVDLARLQVHAYVDEVDIGKVKLGQEATFAVDAYPARDFVGRVAAIYPTATIQDNVVKYIVALDIADDSIGLLRPEMTASVRIALPPRQVLAIPARAIRRDGALNVVTVRGDDGDEVRPVRVGWRDGPWVEIVDGLAAGERIVLDAVTPSGEGRRP